MSVQPPRRLINEFKVNLLTSEGQVEVKYLSKAEIMKMTGLNSRDIRLQVPNPSSQTIGLSIRDRCILINMFYVRVIILHNVMIVYDLEGSLQMQNLITRLQSKFPAEDHFEFVVLESILTDICHTIQNQSEQLKNTCDPILADLLHAPTQMKSKELLPIKQELKNLEIATRNIYDSLETLLESSDDLRQMYLTRRYSVHNSPNTSRNKHVLSNAELHESANINADGDNADGHSGLKSYAEGSNSFREEEDENEEIEDLLEVYFYQIGKLLDRNIIDASVQETDDTVLMMLDIARNRMMTVDLWMNAGSMSLAFGNLIAGIFGMNLLNRLELNHVAFPVVTSLIGLSILLMILLFQSKLSKITI